MCRTTSIYRSDLTYANINCPASVSLLRVSKRHDGAATRVFFIRYLYLLLPCHSSVPKAESSYADLAPSPSARCRSQINA